MRSVGHPPTRSHLRPHARDPRPASLVDAGAPQLVLAFEVAAFVQDHLLDLIDSEIAPFELQPVRTARDR